MNKNVKHLFFILFMVIFYACTPQKEVKIDGELKKWHRIVLNG